MYTENQAIDNIIGWAKNLQMQSNKKETEIFYEFAQPLFRLLGYSKDVEYKEYSIFIENQNFRTDAAYFLTNKAEEIGPGTSLFLVEVKNPNKNIDAAIDQIKLYGMLIRPMYLMLTNGHNTKIFKLHDYRDIEMVAEFDASDLINKMFIRVFYELFRFGTVKELKRAKITDNIPLEILQRKILGVSSYFNILQFIHDLGKQLERSSDVHKNLGEEAIRNLFLLGLNANFSVKGRATGETFNKKGSTDILIRHRNDNIFIAECKIWKGPKLYFKGIDQLIKRYLNTRDKNAAMIFFVRKEYISHVIEVIKSETSKHPNFIDIVSQKDDTWFNYRFRLNDPNVEAKIAILLFDLKQD